MQPSYAVKANPMPAVVSHLSGLVDAFDVASAAEMHTALDTGKPAERVSFAGPGKTPDELSQAVAAGVTIEMESATEAERVLAIGERLGIRPRVAVRVNPDFQVKGSECASAAGPSSSAWTRSWCRPCCRHWRLGPGLPRLPHLRRPQNLNAELLCEAQRKTVELALRLADEAPEPVRYLNLGGGFGIPYFDKDRPLDLPAIGGNLDGLMADAIRPSPPTTRVVVELGRYIVGECGIYVTRIVDRKESRGKTFLVVDGGLHHQLAASGTSVRSSAATTRWPSATGRSSGRRNRERRRLPVHAARPPGGQRGAAGRRNRRPGRGVPGGCLRADRQPNRLSESSKANGGAGVSEVNTPVRVEDVKAVLVETLDVEDQAPAMDATTPLFGSLPELDSMAVLELVLALEERFGIEIEGEDVTAEVFETLASLTAFVDSRLN